MPNSQNWAFLVYANQKALPLGAGGLKMAVRRQYRPFWMGGL